MCFCTIIASTKEGLTSTCRIMVEDLVLVLKVKGLRITKSKQSNTLMLLSNVVARTEVHRYFATQDF